MVDLDKIGVPINTVLNEDCMTTMAKMPDKCINMVMTSPPFWALRDYSGAEMIWGGDKDCEHEWLLHTKKPAGGRGSKCANVGANKNDIANLRDHDIITKFCNKCTAWKGQLGLEPKFDDYISHLCDIFDEVKRILRDDGTIWINMGTTMQNKNDVMIPERFALEMTSNTWILKENLSTNERKYVILELMKRKII